MQHNCQTCSKVFTGRPHRKYCCLGCAPRSGPVKEASYNERHKKILARHAVRQAIRHGDLNPKPCEECNKSAFYSEAHHPDYDKPLDVKWLCRDCHRSNIQKRNLPGAKAQQASSRD